MGSFESPALPMRLNNVVETAGSDEASKRIPDSSCDAL